MQRAERGAKVVGSTEFLAVAFVGTFWIAAICCFVVWHGRRAQRRAAGDEREARP